MEFEIPDSEPPVDVELDRARHLRLTWGNGRIATFSLDTLRDQCPCAQCRGLRTQGRTIHDPATATRPLEAVSAELVGNWGIQIRWNDGHDTGIFAWGVLARMASE